MRKIKLSRIIDSIESGSRPKGGKRESGIPSIGAGELNDHGGFSFEKLGYIPLDYFEKLNRGIINSEDVIVVKDGATTGKTSYVGHDFPFKRAAVNEHVFILRVDRSAVLPKYLFYFLYSPIGFDGIMEDFRGATVGGISQKFINKIEIPLPSLSEQKAIVAKLDRAQRLIDIDKEMLAKYDDLIQSVFLEMFGDPVTNPKGWEKFKMKELSTVQRGGSPRPIKDFLGGNIPWIKISDGTKGDDLYIYSTEENIIEDGIRKTRLLEPGSLILANSGVSLGFARILRIRGCIHDGWLSIADLEKDKIEPIFLLKQLNQLTDHFRRTAPDGTQPNLNTGIVKKLEVLVPPLKTQEAFRDIVLKVREETDQLNESLKKSEALFLSLVQGAFG